jgi:capsular polysaccharide export protein
MKNQSDPWAAIGFSSWKKKFVLDFLRQKTQIDFLSNKKITQLNSLTRYSNIIVWSSRLVPELERFCLQMKLPLWRMEDGFIRSAGLGTDLVRPISLVMDSCGIYYDATRPSDLENFLNTYVFDSDLKLRAQAIRCSLVKARVSKYNVGRSSVLDFPSNKCIILVPGQVESDASILKGSPQIKTNTALLEVVRKANPDAFIIYKPHPDVIAEGREGSRVSSCSANLFDAEVVDVPIVDLLDKVDELHTLTSLAGFEALLRGVKVVTYGLPFYAGWGLTKDHLVCERRTKKLSLDELVAATLVLYPIYVDPLTTDKISCEEAISIISQQVDNPQGPGLVTQIARLFKRYSRLFKR